ncbi:MAG: DUF177 domain-containing protein [Candidatus Marinimicrobia bacterium]|jgi:uncharacterized protein|nr:DUF177 domain-containing protein [Candidatus Neomarinimicrobiota bacterium]
MQIRLNALREGFQKIEGSLPRELLDISDEWFKQPLVDVNLSINKGSSEISIDGIVRAEAEFECDRCLVPFTQNLQSNFQVILTTGNIGPEQIDENIISITQTTMEVDISNYIRDAVLLSVPMKKLCDENCRGLCSRCGVNLNLERCKCGQNESDDRWEPLKKMLTLS